MGDLPCAGTLVSPTGEELNSGLDDAHFRDTSSRRFFHDLQSLSCVSKGMMGGYRLTGSISPPPASTATLRMITSKVSTTGSCSSCGPAHRPCPLASQNLREPCSRPPDIGGARIYAEPGLHGAID